MPSTTKRRAPSPAEITMMAGGGVCLIFSFLSFYEVSISGFGSSSTSAWGSGLFPTATLIVLFALIGGGLAAARAFDLRLPRELLTFSVSQLMLASGFFAALLALSYLITDHGGVDFGIGYYFMLIGAIAVLVGAVMDLRTRSAGR